MEKSETRILVTGGVGFIGYHLCRALLLRGYAVTIVDDFSDAPYPRTHKERNAADLLSEFPGARIITACVTHRTALAPLVEDMSAVIHLAGLAGVRPSFADPARYARVNVEGSATVYELARQAGVGRFLFASSSSVYGNTTPLPAEEDAPAVTPESPYAASKRGAELLVQSLARQAPAMPCTALRFFTVYGARQRPEMAITLFTQAILDGRAITIFGDGTMRRDFTHVGDIVRGVLAALDRAPAGFRAYNLGSGAPIDLHALIAANGWTTGMAPVVHHAPIRPRDVEATFANLERARRDLGWEPRIPLADGLRDVCEWIRAGRG
jgi:UDP-glucuronate 4-epimerase